MVSLKVQDGGNRQGADNSGIPKVMELAANACRLRDRNRRMLAKALLEDFCVAAGPSRDGKEDSLIDHLVGEPKVLQAYASMCGLDGRIRLWRLGRAMKSTKTVEGKREAAMKALAIIASDPEVYGNRAAKRAAEYLLCAEKKACQELRLSEAL